MHNTAYPGPIYNAVYVWCIWQLAGSLIGETTTRGVVFSGIFRRFYGQISKEFANGVRFLMMNDGRHTFILNALLVQLHEF